MRTCTCGVISHLYRNKLDVAKGGKEVQEVKAPVGGLGWRGPSAESRGGASYRVFSPQAGKERFLCLFQIDTFMCVLVLEIRIVYDEVLCVTIYYVMQTSKTVDWWLAVVDRIGREKETHAKREKERERDID